MDHTTCSQTCMTAPPKYTYEQRQRICRWDFKMSPVDEDICAPRCCAHISLRRRINGPTYSKLDPLYIGDRVKIGVWFMHLPWKFSFLQETISIISMTGILCVSTGQVCLHRLAPDNLPLVKGHGRYTARPQTVDGLRQFRPCSGVLHIRERV